MKTALQRRIAVLDEGDFHVSIDSAIVRRGDLIRASGGPTFQVPGKKAQYLIPRGVFRVKDFLWKRGRLWLDCTRLTRPRGTRSRSAASYAVASGRFLLFVLGKPYKRAAFPGVLWRPFMIRKIR